jgi:DNA-binding IclR family transcriptional regulator
MPQKRNREVEMKCPHCEEEVTESGTKMLRALKSGLSTPEAVAQEAGLPLFRVRSGLRELVQAGIVEQNGDDYHIIDKGAGLAI